MNEFRQALDAHVDGKMELPNLERELTLALSRQPQMAAAHGAYVEAVYRSGRIPGETYLKLIQSIRTFQQSVPQAVAAAKAAQAQAAAPAAGAQDKTRFRAPAPSPSTPAAPAAPEADKTQFRAPRATTPPPSPPPPSPSPPQPETWPPPTGTGSRTGGSITGGSRPTGSNWSDPSRWGDHGEPLGSGSVVKDRFVLEEELGRGGMGIVFKARDIRKEEAQDRNPYVAIKVLNEEFKRHPESLKALQRESRKAQHLAHPNVVTVYDFDRDGANVFMVMELLEGESLDRIIRDASETGIGVDRALLLTRDLCRAMAYAHEQGVVHSDFKPANAYLTKEGVVKVFDFGIARAAKRADNVSGSTTLFDPGSLGALTPTYASCEMIEGLEPDPRDDVYAISCVAYELLTGKHPFNRLSAVQARDKQMVPKRPRGLKRVPWRALKRGLAFSREERSASAMQLLNELIPRKRRPTIHIGAAAVIVVVLVIVGAFLPGYLEKRREQAMIDALSGGDAEKIDAIMAELRTISPERRAAVLQNEAGRAGLVRFFDTRMNSAVADESAPDYARARALLDELRTFMPDSLAVKDLEDRLVARENDEIKRQSDLFDDYLRRGLLVDAQGPQNIGTALAAIRRIDAENRLLRDPRLPGAFAEQAGAALSDGNVPLAQALITAGLSFDARDAALTDLQDLVLRVANEQQFVARAQSLEVALASVQSPQATLADVDAKRKEIDELRAVSPDSVVLRSIQLLAQRNVAAQSASLVAQGNTAQAQDLVARYADMLPADFVGDQRQRLASAQGAAEQRAAAVTQIKGRIDALLRSQNPASAWGTQFGQELRQLAAYLPDSDPYVADVRSRTAAGYLAQSRALRSAQRLTEAGRMLDQARRYSPPATDLAAEEKLLVDARTASEAASRERNRLAQIDALKQKLLVQARANEVTEALASLKALRSNLPAEDAYLAVQAPEAIGAAYLRLASSAARDGRFANAVSLAGRAGEMAPSMPDISPAKDRYARYQALERVLATSRTLDVATTRNELDRLSRVDAAESAAVKQQLARDLVTRIRATTDAQLASRLTAAGRELFGDEPFNNLKAAPAAAPAQPPSGAVPAPTPAAPTADATPAPTAAGTRPGATPAAGGTRVAAVRPGATPADQSGTARLPPDIACSDKLAGYGRRKQAVCYDTFDGGGRGPDLVVVPAGGAAPRAFAIGRTEISNADYSTYCTRTGNCKAPSADGALPLVGVSLADAQRYLAWLSQVTGVRYRLPTDAEWTYAATAQGGKLDTSSLNCTIEINGKKVRGGALEAAQSGSANGWGLYNHLGNAQEWVSSAAGTVARGGSYSDSVSQCTTGTTHPHIGSADPVTGLRVVRELE
jgi:serine/threonine protein kinase